MGSGVGIGVSAGVGVGAGVETGVGAGVATATGVGVGVEVASASPPQATINRAIAARARASTMIVFNSLTPYSSDGIVRAAAMVM